MFIWEVIIRGEKLFRKFSKIIILYVIICSFLSLCCCARIIVNPVKSNSQKSQGDVTNGVECMENGEHEKALQYFNSAIDKDPDNDRNYASRGNVYYLLGQYKKALENYDKAIQLNPKDSIYYSNKALMLLKLSKPDEALTVVNVALKLDENNPGALGNRSQIYQNLGRYDEAISDATKLISLKQGNDFLSDGFLSRGVSYFFKKKYSKSIEDINESIKLTSSNARLTYCYYYLGENQRALNKKVEAKASYKKFLNIADELPDYQRAQLQDFITKAKIYVKD